MVWVYQGHGSSGHGGAVGGPSDVLGRGVRWVCKGALLPGWAVDGEWSGAFRRLMGLAEGEREGEVYRLVLFHLCRACILSLRVLQACVFR